MAGTLRATVVHSTRTQDTVALRFHGCLNSVVHHEDQFFLTVRPMNHLETALAQVESHQSAPAECPSTWPIEIEVIAFRYIHREDAELFCENLRTLGIPLFGQEGGGMNASQSSNDPVSSSSWDYPDFREEVVDASRVHMIFGDKPQTLDESELNEVRIISIEQPPTHYPYSYALGFHFRLLNPQQSTTKARLLDLLQAATAEIKEYTDKITLKARFRPVFWFLRGVPPELRGMRGAIQKVQAPDGHTKVEIERGFPHASYIIYDALPSTHDLLQADLALVSVVAHAVERGHRQELQRENEAIEKLLDQLDNVSLTAAASSRELRHNLYEVEAAQRKIREHAHRFHQTRRNLIRTKGLVQRVHQIGGNDDDRTVYDVVCDDAITQIEDEVSMSEEQLVSGIKAVSDRVAIIHSQINNRYGMLTASRTRKLQQLAIMLQSTGIAFVVFQVLERLWNVPTSISEQQSIWCCWTPDPLRVFRAVILVLLTAAAFGITLGVLRWRLKPRQKRNAN